MRFFKLLNGFRKQSGVSLVELMVAAGLIGFLSLAIATLSRNANKSVKKAEDDASLTQFMQQLRGRLSRSDVCMRVFRFNTNVSSDQNITTLTFPIVNDTVLPSSWVDETPPFLSSLPAPNNRVGGYNEFILKRMWLERYKTPPATRGECVLNLEIERKREQFGVTSRVAKLPLSCRIASATDLTMVDCQSGSVGDEQLWTSRQQAPTGYWQIINKELGGPNTQVVIGDGGTPVLDKLGNPIVGAEYPSSRLVVKGSAEIEGQLRTQTRVCILNECTDAWVTRSTSTSCVNRVVQTVAATGTSAAVVCPGGTAVTELGISVLARGSYNGQGISSFAIGFKCCPLKLAP